MTVLTLGTFDLFHRGHVRLLARASELGPVTVALNTDKFITDYKGKPPVMTYQERFEVLEACRWVSKLVANHGDSTPLINSLKPAFIVIGDDWHGKDYLGQLQVTKETLKKHGTAVVYVPYTGGVSTSQIRERCLASPSSARSTAATKTLDLFYTPYMPGHENRTKRGSSGKPLTITEFYGMRPPNKDFVSMADSRSNTFQPPPGTASTG